MKKYSFLHEQQRLLLENNFSLIDELGNNIGTNRS